MPTITSIKMQLVSGLKRGGLIVAFVMTSIVLVVPVQAAGTQPTTFGSTIGPALLCVDQIDPYYFWTYMNQYFGPPYKREGGAYWFKVEGTLWGAPISEVLVSDGAYEQVFLAASFKDGPAKLSAAIADSTGIRHFNQTTAPYSPLVSGMGSKIVYTGQSAKIYCAKYNLDFRRR